MIILTLTQEDKVQKRVSVATAKNGCVILRSGERPWNDVRRRIGDGTLLSPWPVMHRVRGEGARRRIREAGVHSPRVSRLLHTRNSGCTHPRNTNDNHSKLIIVRKKLINAYDFAAAFYSNLQAIQLKGRSFAAIDWSWKSRRGIENDEDRKKNKGKRILRA